MKNFGWPVKHTHMIKITLSYRFNFLQKVLVLCLWAFLALGSTDAFAQFAVVEDFRGGGNPDVIIGDNAILTSGNADPVNSGWLRLTPSVGNRKGYAYINKSFPATLGVLMDFEYKIWRDIADTTYSGADGLSIFLFDGDINSSTFALGGYGGSLGYAKLNSEPGLKGGYVGIGIDEYGNFANTGDGGKFGGPGARPNSIVMRGPTTTNNTAAVVGGVQPTNRFLSGKTIRTTDGVNFSYLDILSNTGDGNQNAIDYNTVTPTRPNDATFYRRVQIEIQRVDLAGEYYKIIVRWKTKPSDIDFTQILEYTTQDVPPALLKIGFASGTGGGFNYHEIRNLFVTTPGNLRVIKRADKDLLQLDTANNIITYNIEVTNDTEFEVPNVAFMDKITDAYGDNLIEGTDYNVESISTTGFVSTALPDAATITSNVITGTLVLGAKKTGRITMVVKLLRTPPGNILTNLVNVDYPLDEDKNNNTSIVRTPVIATGLDLVLSKTVTQECIDTSTTTLPIFTVNLSNIGAGSTTYDRLGTSSGTRIAIYNTVPAGYIYDDTSTPGGFAGTVSDPQNGNTTARWSKTSVLNPDGSTTYRYIARGTNTSGATETLGAGVTYPFPIRYTVKPPIGVTTYQDVSAAMTFTDLNFNTNSIEPVANQSNNKAIIVMNLKPAAPAVPPGTIYYCVGEDAAVLTATATGSNTLRWYVTPNGFSSEFAIKPDTSIGGTFTYYVSQVNGNCESTQTPMTVIVSPVPGSISSTINTVCTGGAVGIISGTNPTNNTGSSGSFAYRWEKTTDLAGSWTVITGATGQNLTAAQSGTITVTTYFRRVAVLTTPGKVCEARTNSLRIAYPTAGVIGNPQTFCGGNNTNYDPDPLTNVDDGDGTGYTYQWESSTTGAANSYSDISGATGSTYDPPQTNVAVTYYRRKKITSCTGTPTSNIIIVSKVSSNSNPTAGTLNNQTICGGTTPTISGTPGTPSSGVPGVVTYEWQYSTSSNTGPWQNLSETGPTYTPTDPINATTYFRRRARNVCGNQNYSSYVTATITIQVNPGDLGPDKTICYDSSAGTIGPGTAGSVASGTRSYSWEQATGTTGGTFTSIPGNPTGNSYTPPGNLTTSMRYRRYTQSSAYPGCKPYDEITVVVKIATDPKTIGPAQTICNGATPTTLTGDPAAGDGVITYLWQESTTNLAASWGTASATHTGNNSNNNVTYIPRPITMYYRRAAYADGTCVAYTPSVLVTMQSAVVRGTIVGPATNICYGTSTTISSTATGSGSGSGTITYRWQSAPGASGGSFSDIAGQTGETLTTSILTATTRFQRFTVSTQNGVPCESAATNIVTVNVYAAIAEGGIGIDQKICNGIAPQELMSTSSATGVTYKWQNSINNGADWFDISGAVGSSYQPPTLTTTTMYRRISILTATGCQSGPTVPVTITVVPVVDPGGITGNQVICMDTQPTILGSSGVGTNTGANSIAYRWESSANGSSGWTTIPTATGTTYLPGIVRKTTYYRRVTIATFTGGVGTIVCEGFTTPVSVTTKNCKVITNPMIYQKVKGN